jgi:uncharacterized protein with NRDE domain
VIPLTLEALILREKKNKRKTMMNEELYSFDEYKGFNIFITEDNNLYYGDIYFNGTQMERDIKSMSPLQCLFRCKAEADAIIAAIIHYEGDNHE